MEEVKQEQSEIKVNLNPFPEDAAILVRVNPKSYSLRNQHRVLKAARKAFPDNIVAVIPDDAAINAMRIGELLNLRSRLTKLICDMLQKEDQA